MIFSLTSNNRNKSKAGQKKKRIYGYIYILYMCVCTATCKERFQHYLQPPIPGMSHSPRITAASVAMARLNKIWNSRKVAFHTKLGFTMCLLCQLCCMVVRHGPCSLNQRQIKVFKFEIKCFRRHLQVSYREQKMNDLTLPKMLLQAYTEGGQQR